MTFHFSFMNFKFHIPYCHGVLFLFSYVPLFPYMLSFSIFGIYIHLMLSQLLSHTMLGVWGTHSLSTHPSRTVLAGSRLNPPRLWRKNPNLLRLSLNLGLGFLLFQKMEVECIMRTLFVLNAGGYRLSRTFILTRELP